jgi:hypothetical protein
MSTSEFERLRRKWRDIIVVFLRFYVLYLCRLPVKRNALSVHCAGLSLSRQPIQANGDECAMQSTWKSKDEFYENTARFTYLIYVFMSFRCLLDVKHRCQHYRKYKFLLFFVINTCKTVLFLRTSLATTSITI